MPQDNAACQRDYRLTGPEAARAAEKGLVSADWYQSPISRQRMKQLMQRRDGPALLDTAIWLLALLVSGFGGYWFWVPGHVCRSSWRTAFFTPQPPTRAGTRLATAPRSRPGG
ncbi:hypothetical protein BV361_03115 [Pseudomonas syringae pv. actinidiae]|nr:hypothetical protein BV361_03115 [Pseudomonas syringae pv. actinidiae]